jgi:heptaprenyl diphosphate synthase
MARGTLRIATTREDHRIAWLAALAIAIHVLEAALPSPLPGVKPGLANVITIVVLVQFGWRTAAWVGLLRVLCGSLLLGTFLSPTFFLSLAGALASLAVLGLATRLPGRGFGPVGYGLLAAQAHMLGQFLVAYRLFIPHAGLWTLLPLLLTAALLFGLLSGIIARMMLQGVRDSA